MGMMNERGWEEASCGGGLRLFSSPGIAAASQYFLAKAWDGVLARREPSLLLLRACYNTPYFVTASRKEV